MNQAGEKLKKIRLEKGLTLEEVQKKTKIHPNILRAIEGEGITNLSPVYLKSFLKIYCQFLGVDPREYIPDYKETQATVKDVLSHKELEKKPVRIKSPWQVPEKFKKIFILVLIILFLSLVLFNLGKCIASKGKAVLEKRKSAIPKVVNTAVKKTAQAPAAAETKTKKEISNQIRLGIRARENCWVSLKVDGRMVFQRVLEKGRFETWKANEKMDLSLGNAGAVEIEVNGQRFTNLGKRGQKRNNIVITKEGLNIGR